MTWLTACTNYKPASSDMFLLLHQGKAFAVWNEDTVNSYQIAFMDNHKFAYAIVRTHNSEKEKEYYKGTFKFSQDTFFLTYHKDLRPSGVTNYLVLEASRHYLIQPFTNNAKRFFLRIQKFGRFL